MFAEDQIRSENLHKSVNNTPKKHIKITMALSYRTHNYFFNNMKAGKNDEQKRKISR